MSRFPREGLTRRSSLLLHWRAADVGLHDPRNLTSSALTPLKPVTGQTVTFTRASEASATDAGGSSYTVGHSQPAWSWAADEPGLLVAPAATGRNADKASVAFGRSSIASHSGYVAARFTGTARKSARVGIGTGVLTVEAGDATGGGTRTTLLHWGATGTSATGWVEVASAGLATGELVEVGWTCSSSGKLVVQLAKDGGAVLDTTSGSAATGVNAAPSGVLYIGSKGATSQLDGSVVALKLAAGSRALTTMRTVF